MRAISKSKSTAAALRACTALLAVFDPDISGRERRALFQRAVDYAMEATGMPKDERPDATLLCDNWGLVPDATEA